MKWKKALHCYGDTHRVDVDSFGECMVRDGFFLIELFRGTWRQDLRSDMFFNRMWMMPLLKRDVLLFENQISLFVLRALFALTDQTHNECDLVNLFASMEERHDSDSKFVEQALGFFYKPIPNLNLQISQLDRIPHLLGLVYEALVVSGERIDLEPETPKQQNFGRWKSLSSMRNKWSPFVRIMKALVRKTPEQSNNRKKSWELIWTAMALEQAGVQFRPAHDRKAFYDICFRSDGVLSIPPLVIDDSKESFFRNLVAYEQHSKYYTFQLVGNYLKVMDCLINSAKDVELLRHCGIIDNGLGDDEKVSTMFNHLCSGVCYDPAMFVFAEMFNEVNKFCKKRRNVWIAKLKYVWIAKLKNEYFGSPWALVSFLAAVLLLSLTILQTVYSVLSYNQPKI